EGLVGDLHRRLPGLRIARSLAVFEAMVPTILEQKVTGREARASWHAMVRAWGTPAPGPEPLLVPPGPALLARAPAPYWEFPPLGVEMKRANAIRSAATRATRLEAVAAPPPAVARQRLQAV